MLRTWRHNSIRTLVASSLKPLGRVSEEVSQGPIRHDILITDADIGRLFIDIGICHAPTPTSSFTWPNQEQVVQAIAQRTASPGNSQLFFWEDRSDEPSHPRAIEIRTFRSLCLQASVGTSIGEMEAKKTHYFLSKYPTTGPNTARSFLPFIMSSGGCLNQKSKDFLWEAMERMFSKIRDRAQFRLRLYATLAIQLIRFSLKMARRINGIN